MLTLLVDHCAGLYKQFNCFAITPHSRNVQRPGLKQPEGIWVIDLDPGEVSDSFDFPVNVTQCPHGL